MFNIEFDLVKLLTLLLDSARGNFYISDIESIYENSNNFSIKVPIKNIGTILSYRYPVKNERDHEEVERLESQYRADIKKIQQFCQSNHHTYILLTNHKIEYFNYLSDHTLLFL